MRVVMGFRHGLDKTGDLVYYVKEDTVDPLHDSQLPSSFQ